MASRKSPYLNMDLPEPPDAFSREEYVRNLELLDTEIGEARGGKLNLKSKILEMEAAEKEQRKEMYGGGVVSGLAVTRGGALNGTVTLGAGYLPDGTRITKADTPYSLSAADLVYPRIDVVYIDSAGAVVVRAGVPADNPVAPVAGGPDGNHVTLAEIYVPAGATVIPTDGITDKRLVISKQAEVTRDLGKRTALSTSNKENVVAAVNEVNQQLADISKYRNVLDYGVTGDGLTDDTVAVNNLAGGYTWVFPSGTYMIKAHTDDLVGYGGFRPKANTKYIFLPGSKLKALTSPSAIYNVVWIDTVGCELHNIVVEGERSTHVGTTGEYGYGINIRNNAMVKLYNPVTYDCWGDGIIVNTIEGSSVEIFNADSYNNRRQGISVMCCDVLRVYRSSFRDTNGTSPQRGVDIEPNYPTDILNDILFEDCEFNNNASNGIGIYGANGFPVKYKIDFVRCKSIANVGFSVVVQGTPLQHRGKINFRDCEIEDGGFHVIDSQAHVFVDNLKITDAPYSFRLENTKADTVVGGLTAKNIQLVDTDNTPVKAVSFLTSNSVSNNLIKDVDIDIVSHNFVDTKGLIVNDGSKLKRRRLVKWNSTKKATTSIFSSTTPIYSYQKITNEGATASVTIEINSVNSRVDGNTFEFEVVDPYNMIIRNVDANIFPYAAVAIQSNTVGSKIKLEYKNAKWVVIEQIGTWTVV